MQDTFCSGDLHVTHYMRTELITRWTRFLLTIAVRTEDDGQDQKEEGW